jgi:hypothetical protein
LRSVKWEIIGLFRNASWGDRVGVDNGFDNDAFTSKDWRRRRPGQAFSRQEIEFTKTLRKRHEDCTTTFCSSSTDLFSTYFILQLSCPIIRISHNALCSLYRSRTVLKPCELFHAEVRVLEFVL